MPSLTLWCCSWSCDSASDIYSKVFYQVASWKLLSIGGGRTEKGILNIFLFHSVLVPPVAICTSLYVLLATLEPASGTPQKYSVTDGAPYKYLSTLLQVFPLCVWILIILSLSFFPRLRMVGLSSCYNLWFTLVFPLYFLSLLTLVLNNSFLCNVINWFAILLTRLKSYHYHQIDLYPYRCFPFLFYSQ